MIRARDNPFAVQRTATLAYRFPSGESWQRLLRRLRSRSYRGALVGGPGRGKSTLLGELGHRLEERGFRTRRLTLRRGDRRPPRGRRRRFPSRPGRQTVILLDGAEQLTPPSWWWLRFRSRRAGGLIVTSHRPGRLSTLLECRTTPEMLEDLLETLAPDRPRGFPTSETLHRRHGGDLRRALFEAYDAWSEEDRPLPAVARKATSTSIPQATGTSQGEAV